MEPTTYYIIVIPVTSTGKISYWRKHHRLKLSLKKLIIMKILKKKNIIIMTLEQKKLIFFF